MAQRLGISSPRIKVSGIGGEVPQHFVNQAAGMLTRDETKAVLICGAETFYPRSKSDVRGPEALSQGIRDDYDADDARGNDELEQRHGLTMPIHGFPLFEYAKDRQRFMVAKADFTRSPALAAIAEKTQQRAGITINDLEGFDLYSCFLCAVSVARGELGIASDDSRPLTQTGGLGACRT